MKAAIISVFLALIATYFAGKASGEKGLAYLQGQLAQQQEQAEEKLKEAHENATALQSKAQEKLERQQEKDRENIERIKDLQRALASQPIRVRYQATSGASGNCAARAQDESTRTGTANRTEASRLLPESNSQRLAAAIAEIETLSAAYSSCRATLELK